MLAVLISPLVVWWVGYRATLDVVAMTGVPDCQGTEPVLVDDGGFRRTAIPMKPGSTCTLSIKVVNESRHDVEVDGSALASIRGAGFDAASSPFGDQQHTLYPGDGVVLTLRLEYRASDCDAGQSGASLEPFVRVQDTIASHDLVVAGLPLLLAAPSCDS